jgi:cytosine/adenosine deaminase-related metal-dependent hydrolase
VGLRETTESSLAESHRLAKRWHGAAGGRLQYAYCPRFVLSCSEALLKEVAKVAKSSSMRVHTHASENPTECDAVRQRSGLPNVELFHQLGLTGPHVTLAHCIWLTAQEQRRLRETRTVVCHCASSNLKLASGIAKVPELLDDGVRVALGADGAACSNNLDIFTEMRLAALLQKPRLGPLAMPPMRVLEMATLQGAAALGLSSEVGSIEEGKRADLTIVDLRRAHALPLGQDVVGQLVYSGQGSDVAHVMVDGRFLMKDKQLLTLDEAEVCQRALRHAERIAKVVA